MIIICVLGGVTYAEIHQAAEIERRTGCTVLIGGSEVLTPSAYLERLSMQVRHRHSAPTMLERMLVLLVVARRCTVHSARTVHCDAVPSRPVSLSSRPTLSPAPCTLR